MNVVDITREINTPMAEGREPNDNDFRIAQPEAAVEFEKGHRRFTLWKKFFEFLLVVVICSFLFLLRYFNFLGNEAVSALVGALIGYCFEYWRFKRD